MGGSRSTTVCLRHSLSAGMACAWREASSAPNLFSTSPCTSLTRRAGTGPIIRSGSPRKLRAKMRQGRERGPSPKRDGKRVADWETHWITDLTRPAGFHLAAENETIGHGGRLYDVC